VRRELLKQLPFSNRLQGDKELKVLQIAQAAVDQLGTFRAGAARKVALFEKERLDAARGCILGDSGAGYAAAYDNQVELVASKLGESRSVISRVLTTLDEKRLVRTIEVRRKKLYRRMVDLPDRPTHLRDEWTCMCRDASAPLRKGGMRAWREVTRKQYECRLAQFLGWYRLQNPQDSLATQTWASLLSAPARDID